MTKLSTFRRRINKRVVFNTPAVERERSSVNCLSRESSTKLKSAMHAGTVLSIRKISPRCITPRESDEFELVVNSSQLDDGFSCGFTFLRNAIKDVDTREEIVLHWVFI